MPERVSHNTAGLQGSAGHSSDNEVFNHEHEEIIRWLQTVRFRKAFFGGVDETDLWKKLAALNELYEASLRSERARYDALLAAYTKSARATVAEYKQTLTQEREQYAALKKGYLSLKAALGERNGDE